ncbi:hypothetical protein QVD17_26544 [Tagetes erecta]|uniref:Uncharacterized protein n=1 Tax=Tagetes erecta TaxID=13708 RepID=A0AAD8KB89_TARER|nr:hypothetical protein QVD17_26544 [Tagetes erecta]
MIIYVFKTLYFITHNATINLPRLSTLRLHFKPAKSLLQFIHMEQYHQSTPILWSQPPITTNRRRAPPIDPVFLIILIPIIALLFLFFFIPPLLYHTSHILKPASVKSTWDSVNMFLVIFAIICGVMSRKNDDVSVSSDVHGFVVSESSDNVQSSPPWIGFYDRFSNDLDVDNRSTTFYGGVYQQQRRCEADQVDFSDVKEIAVDTFVVTSNPPAETPPVPHPPPLPPLPSAPSYNSKRHSFRSVGKNINVVSPETESDELDKVRSESSEHPPPSTEIIVYRSHHKHKTLERKVSDVATAISSLYNQRKAKKKRKHRNNMTTTSVQSPETEQPPVYQNLFKKGGKHKKIHSIPSTVTSTIPPPPPPPPPRPSSIFNSIFKSGTKTKRFQSRSPDLPSSSIINNLFKTGTKSKRFNHLTAVSTPLPLPPPEPKLQIRQSTSKRKPPLPTKTSSFYERDQFLSSGSQSPLIPLPPPPPPFKMPAMKFEVRGDFIKIQSTQSSVCSSPDHDAVDLCSTLVDNNVDYSVGPGLGSGSGMGLVCCPSPDVNAKADSFISRLKDEWRMERINYVKEEMG